MPRSTRRGVPASPAVPRQRKQEDQPSTSSPRHQANPVRGRGKVADEMRFEQPLARPEQVGHGPGERHRRKGGPHTPTEAGGNEHRADDGGVFGYRRQARRRGRPPIPRPRADTSPAAGASGRMRGAPESPTAPDTGRQERTRPAPALPSRPIADLAVPVGRGRPQSLGPVLPLPDGRTTSQCSRVLTDRRCGRVPREGHPAGGGPPSPDACLRRAVRSQRRVVPRARKGWLRRRGTPASERHQGRRGARSDAVGVLRRRAKPSTGMGSS